MNNGQSAERCRLQAMTDALTHRGPDDSGLWTAGPIGLGHRRLSIIDLSHEAHQPMISHDHNVALVFNGEIYNFPELRDELELTGSRFRSNSDTEIILEGYCRWGEAILPRLNGMFALALIDLRHNRLILARDRFGVKPLYYSFSDKGLVFGSEIKAILCSGLVEKTINHAALAEYLYYSSVLGSKSFFSGIQQLEPGYTLRFTGDSTEFSRFADAIPARESDDDFQTASSTVLELLEQSVQRQMTADVPVGVFLSGGIDSSAIATLAGRHSDKALRTYSADFAFAKDKSELARAKMVANRIGSVHKELHIEPQNLSGTLETLVNAHDQPFGDAANIPIYLMCQQLQGDSKVILQGDGGDELFAGYPRYNRLARKRQMRLLASILLPFTDAIPKASKAYRLLRSLHALTVAPDDMKMALIMSQEPYGSNPGRLLATDFQKSLSEHDPFARYREMYNRFAANDAVQAMLYTDVSLLLPDIYFQKVDRPAMANSIEVRVPMMDNALSTYALSLPSSLKLRGGEKKAVLKQALRGIVPDKILDGKKRGFKVPVSRWLKGPLANYMREVLLDETMQRAELFDSDEISRRIDHHLDGTSDYGQSLYKMLNLALWYQKNFI